MSILHMHAKFQASRFNNKRKYQKVADPLKIKIGSKLVKKCKVFVCQMTPHSTALPARHSVRIGLLLQLQYTAREGE